MLFETIDRAFESLPYHLVDDYLRVETALISSFFPVHVLFLSVKMWSGCFFFFNPNRCSVCCDHLTNWYYEKDGKLYCRKHYWEKFGELCHGCSLLMTGPAMVCLLLSLFNSWTLHWDILSSLLVQNIGLLSHTDHGCPRWVKSRAESI